MKGEEKEFFTLSDTQRIKVEKSTQKQRINQSSVSQSFGEGLAEMEKCCLYDFAWFTVYSAPLPHSEIFIVRRLFTLSLTTQKILFKLWHSQSQINKQLYAVEKSYSLPLRKNHTFRPWKIIKKRHLWDQEQGVFRWSLRHRAISKCCRQATELKSQKSRGRVYAVRWMRL